MQGKGKKCCIIESIMTIIFDGNKVAAEKLAALKERIAVSQQKIKIVALSFLGDVGSELYSKKKQEAATQVGIEYEILNLNFGEPMSRLQTLIKDLAIRDEVTGIMIQKPRRKTYEGFFAVSKSFAASPFEQWWHDLTATLPQEKDVDGLSPNVVQQLKLGNMPPILPATVKAVLASLTGIDWRGKSVLILGKSDLLGLPLFHYFRHLGLNVLNWGRPELAMQLQKAERLENFQVIVSATGEANLIKGNMLALNSILIDVGEPEGDFEAATCLPKAAFMTPVPGGIGPVTVAELLNNAWLLTQPQT